MSLWMHWWNAIWRLRPAFASPANLPLWLLATAVAGFTVRTDMLGVTSIVRALNLDARCYNTLIDYFHSSAVKLPTGSPRCGPRSLVLRLFPSRCASTAGASWSATASRSPGCGRKMPAVKLLHQQSEANTKPEFIMGHSLQAVVACSFRPPPASSPCRSSRAHPLVRDWCGPIAIDAPLLDK